MKHTTVLSYFVLKSHKTKQFILTLYSDLLINMILDWRRDLNGQIAPAC